MKALLRTISVSASLAILSAGEVFAESAEPMAAHHDAAAAAASHVAASHVAEAAASHGAAAGHGSAPGLPQMDPTWFASQLFWLAVTFLVLYVVFAKKVLPELSNVLETRREHVQGDLDTAQTLKDEAEKVHQAYDEILDEARQKSSAVFSEIDEEIKLKAESEYKVFQERAQKETDVFEGRIDKAKFDALENMNSIAAEIAAEAAEKIIGVSTDLDKARDAVKNVTKQAKAA